MVAFDLSLFHLFDLGFWGGYLWHRLAYFCLFVRGWWLVIVWVVPWMCWFGSCVWICCDVVMVSSRDGITLLVLGVGVVYALLGLTVRLFEFGLCARWVCGFCRL